MSYTVTQLITRAYYLSGISSRGLNEPARDQISDGLFLLNALLSFKSADQRLIPYFKEYPFNAVADQEEYFIPNLILAETLTFYIGTVRFTMMQQNRDEYFGTARVDTSSLPYFWHTERCLNGSNLFMYFFPNTDYPLKLWGKFGFDQVSLNDDLLQTFDAYYIEYLRLALAEYICLEYGMSLPPIAQNKLKEYQRNVTDISPMDLSIKKVSSLQYLPALNWGFVNLSGGWTVP